MMSYWCVLQVGEPVEVDGELASILTHSRFKEDFTFRPPGECGPCAVKPKVSVFSKFLDVEMFCCFLSTRGQYVYSV